MQPEMRWISGFLRRFCSRHAHGYIATLEDCLKSREGFSCLNGDELHLDERASRRIGNENECLTSPRLEYILGIKLRPRAVKIQPTSCRIFGCDAFGTAWNTEWLRIVCHFGHTNVFTTSGVEPGTHPWQSAYHPGRPEASTESEYFMDKYVTGRMGSGVRTVRAI